MLLECARCAAPLDVAEGESVIRCRYCGAQTDRTALRLLAATTPQAFRPPERWSAGEGSAVLTLIDCGPNKIAAIKALRTHLRCGLKEGKDLVEAAPIRLDAGHVAAALLADLLAAGASAAPGDVVASAREAAAVAPVKRVSPEPAGGSSGKGLVVLGVLVLVGLGVAYALGLGPFAR